MDKRPKVVGSPYINKGLPHPTFLNFKHQNKALNG